MFHKYVPQICSTLCSTLCSTILFNTMFNNIVQYYVPQICSQICSTILFNTMFHTMFHTTFHNNVPQCSTICSTIMFHTYVPHICSTHMFHKYVPTLCSTTFVVSARQRVHRRRSRRRYQDQLRASLQISKLARYRAGRELFQDEADRQESDIWVRRNAWYFKQCNILVAYSHPLSCCSLTLGPNPKRKRRRGGRFVQRIWHARDVHQ
jgi:hypothetical protein